MNKTRGIISFLVSIFFVLLELTGISSYIKTKDPVELVLIIVILVPTWFFVKRSLKHIKISNESQREINEINRDLNRINNGSDDSENQVNNMLENFTGTSDAVLYDNMEGHDFEYFCADLLKKNGFSNVKVTKGSGDQGIDILAAKDGIKYGIQCKCYSSDIGNKAVQEAFSGKTFYHCHVASVLTNRYFTASAKELAESNGVLLWDRDYLNKLIENAN